MEITIREEAIKDMENIPSPQKEAIKRKIATLENYPEVTGLKKLFNFDFSHRLRIGKYRILIDIEPEKIVVARVRTRKNAYA